MRCEVYIRLNATPFTDKMLKLMLNKSNMEPCSQVLSL